MQPAGFIAGCILLLAHKPSIMKRTLAVAAIVLTACCAAAQAGKALSPDSALALLHNDYPQEKVFLQTDRSYYLSGETVWMKAWCTLEGAPTYLSRILYVDLVNGSGEVMAKKMYRLDSLGSTPADIDLPSNTPSGNYSVNAYTLWMLNFPEYVFHRSIYVYNTDGFHPAAAPAAAPSIKMQFFPEGGDMIAGVKNRVAFKVVDKGGFPADIKGVIGDNTGAGSIPFATEHDGMGFVEITAEAGKKYTATIPGANGRIISFDLPQPKDEGVSLRVENTNPNRLFVLVDRAEKNKAKYNRLKVVVQMHHQLVAEAELNFDEGQTAMPVGKKNLPAGIMQVTVFDSLNNPLAERLAFIENYTLTAPDIKTDTINTNARSGNQFSFSAGNLAMPALSCLVTSDVTDPAPPEENIVSSLLLSSDLRGYIHRPGYYFSNKDAVTLHHLDLLLMTQGWRRFEWKKILRRQFTPLTYPVESAISFRGIVTKSDSKEPVKEGNVSFIIKGEDSTSILADAGLTDKGEFLLNNVHYMKRASVAYMGTNRKKENYIVDVKLAPNYIDSLQHSRYTSAVNLDTIDIMGRKTALSAWLYGTLVAGADTSAFNKAKLLQGVTVTAKRLSKEDSLNREYAGGPFLMGKAVDPSAYKYARSIWQIIQQSVPGVRVEGNPLDPDVRFSRFDGLGSSDNGSVGGMAGPDGSISTDVVVQSNGIAYYLNEVNVSKDVINSLAVEDVALIKVLKNEAAVLGAAQGAIAIYTTKGVIVGKAAYEKTYTVEKKEGYAVVRQFYSPDYALDPLPPGSADMRSTLYWNGRINPAKDGRYRFRFYNNDKGKSFRLLIQGIDRDGKLVYIEKQIR